jgi:DNA-binding transcriptional regulator/RsmH inhibitor MraZ
MVMSTDRSLVYQLAPLGDEDARVDDKGRLKLPAQCVEYLKNIKEDTVFITTFNPAGGEALIYPISEWRYRLGVWQDLAKQGAEKAEAVGNRLKIASAFGAQSTLDAQGRVLVPSQLRKAMNLENTKVYLSYLDGRFNMWGATQYEASLNAALEGAGRSQDLLASLGEG